MVTTISKNFRVFNAKQAMRMLAEADASNIYLFIGRNKTWSDPSNPDTTVDSVDQFSYRIWDSILAVKKINVSDISYGVTRISWQSGSVYTPYNSSTAFYTSNYYVVNSNYDVYKCIDNNFGAASTIQPTGTPASTYVTPGDGYTWKYMYSIPAAEILKFVTTNYIPVKTLTVDDGSYQWDVQAAAANNSIGSIEVLTQGGSYLSHSGTALGGSVSTITLGVGASGSDGTYNNMGVYIVSGTGAGQVRKISGYVGSTKVATVTPNFSPAPNGTSSYLVSPYVDVQGDGSGFSAYTVVVGGKVTGVVPVTYGLNYTRATMSFGGSGSGATGRVNLGPVMGHGGDPVSELYASNLIIDVKLSGSESNTFFTQNAYRVIGIMVDPLIQANNAYAKASSYDMTDKLHLLNLVGTFTKDETVTGGTSGISANMVEMYTANTMRVTENTGSFTLGETITGGTSGATAKVNTVDAHPLKKSSGTILFVDNRTTVTRASDQLEDYKVVLKF